MATYTIKSNMNLGEQTNDAGIRTPVTVNKGQVVQGDLVTSFIYNTNTQGIEYKVPSKMMGTGKPIDGMDTFFIPLSNLNLTNNTGQKSDKTFKYVVMGGLAIILTLGVLKILKVI